jgi:hypothetical protein
VEWLRKDIDRAGIEDTAGILLGAPVADTARRVRITGFLPIELPHDRLLTDGERAEFARRVSFTRRRGPAKPVGYYRGHSQEALSLDLQDLSIIQSCFTATNDVFLLIRPSAANGFAAGFFFWDDGEINPDFSFLEFPLNASELRDAHAIDEPADAKAARHGRLWWGLPAAAAAAMALATFIGVSVPRSRPGEAAPTVQELKLRYQVEGDRVRLMWNGNSRAIAAASAGILSIRDGVKRSAIPLDAGQLKTGSLTYVIRPGSQDVEFRLDVSGKATDLSAELSAALPRAPLPTGVAPARELPGPRPVEEAHRSLSKPLREFSAGAFPPSASKAPGADPTLPEPPPVAVASLAAETVRLAGAAEMAAPAPEPPPPIAPSAIAPAPASRSALPELAYVPPKPVRLVQPVLPPDLASVISRRTQVLVKISIDDKGKIVEAAPVADSQAPANLLGTLAATAAKRWVFEPARRNSVAVPAELVLNFDFEPGRRR